MINLPNDADGFIDSVRRNSLSLIDRGFWDISKSRYDGWIAQFCTTEEKFFAACLLDSLIFRTSTQFESSLRALFRSNLNLKTSRNECDSFLHEKLVSRAEPKIRIVPVISDDDPPTKSGPLVLRRLQRVLNLNQKWMCWPWQAIDLLKSGKIESIIFIDDFIGCGTQFTEFYTKWGFADLNPNIEYCYASAMAHEVGIKCIKDKFPSLNIVFSELIEENHSFFSDAMWERLGGGTISSEEAKTWYDKFSTDNKITPKNGKFGVGELALTLGFSHSTPNNSLPILWYENYNSNWKPLLER